MAGKVYMAELKVIRSELGETMEVRRDNDNRCFKGT